MCIFYNGAVAPMKVKINSFKIKINQIFNTFSLHFILTNFSGQVDKSSFYSLSSFVLYFQKFNNIHVENGLVL